MPTSVPTTRELRPVQGRFDMDPAHGPVCIQKIGYEEGSATVIERVTDDHIRAYPAEFERFQTSRASVAPVGTSLRRGLGMPDELIRLFNVHGVMDVETFATLNDMRIHQMMPGNPEFGVELRDRARLMVPEDRRTPLAASPVTPAGPASRQEAVAEIEALKAKLAQAERERDGALALVEAATPPIGTTDEPHDITRDSETSAEIGEAIRRGPGRPRKIA